MALKKTCIPCSFFPLCFLFLPPNLQVIFLYTGHAFVSMTSDHGVTAWPSQAGQRVAASKILIDFDCFNFWYVKHRGRFWSSGCRVCKKGVRKHLGLLPVRLLCNTFLPAEGKGISFSVSSSLPIYSNSQDTVMPSSLSLSFHQVMKVLFPRFYGDRYLHIHWPKFRQY